MLATALFCSSCRRKVILNGLTLRLCLPAVLWGKKNNNNKKKKKKHPETLRKPRSGWLQDDKCTIWSENPPKIGVHVMPLIWGNIQYGEYWIICEHKQSQQAPLCDASKKHNLQLLYLSERRNLWSRSEGRLSGVLIACQQMHRRYGPN